METCEFLENLTFASLISPVTMPDFRANYWEKKPLVVHRNDPHYYGDLFTLRDFDRALANEPGDVETADHGKNKRPSRKDRTVGDLEAILTNLRDGGSVILNHHHHHNPRLGLLCRILGCEIGHLMHAHLYLTPERGRGFPPHWDSVDAFVLQVVGSKKWTVDRERSLFPIRPHKMPPGSPEVFRGEVISFTLNQGDIAYIPRGFMHAAECRSEASLHLTLGLVPVVVQELLDAVIKAATNRDERLRVALPLNFMHGDAKGLVELAGNVLRGLAEDDRFLEAVVNQFRDELIRTHPLDISGQVEDFLQHVPLARDDIVRLRPGVMFRMQATADGSVRVNVGTRSITFPGRFGEAVEFALRTRVYAIGDITGGLADEERMLLVDRLIEEGLVLHQPKSAACPS
jgi:ribosomal protein L16 Arg81 hydroxylase